jgi:pimeloyl-ACP methyl ester carboxylesterase
VDKFAYIAKPFVEAGYDVIGMDYKGFGHSEGLRGFINDRNEFYDNGYQFVKKARKFYSELYPSVGENIPFFTMGYSQGGALSHGIARLLHENGDKPLAGQLHVVPNFAIQQDHWTEEYRKELAEKKQDHTQTCVFPAKPLKDWSFLIGYVSDELQFKGPHYAVTIDIVKEVSDADREYFNVISHPVHIVRADGDNILNNAEINRYFETIKTPADLKEIHGYDSDHYILSDGWLKDEVIANQLKFVEKVLSK